MIVQKPGDVDPAMKSALKNHIMRKRLQLKQELEQDAIEKRLKREQEAKRKQDAMTLDQLKEQLGNLEKTLDNLKNEKHSLFAQLKQNMRVLNEDDTRRKQKEGEINAARQQQQQLQQSEQNNRQPQQLQNQQQHHLQQLNQHHLIQQHQSQQQLSQQQQHQQPPPPPSHLHIPNQPLQPSQQQQQQSASNGPIVQQQQPTLANQENHMPMAPRDIKAHDLPNQQQQQPPAHMFQHQPPPPISQQQQQQQRQQQQPPPPPPQQQQQSSQQSNHHEQDTLQNIQNSHQQLQSDNSHIQRSNSIFNSAAAFSHLLNAHNFPRQSPYLTHLPPSTRPSNPYGSMSPYPPPMGHHPPPSLISGHGIPTSLPHVPQSSSVIRPSPPPPPMSNNSGHLNSSGPPKMPLSLPITSSAPTNQMDFSPNSVNSTAHQMQQQALNNSAAAAAAALGIPYGSPYFNSGSPIGPPMSSHQALDHHALNAAAAAAAAVVSNHSNHMSGNGGNNSNNGGNNNINNASSNSNRGNSMPPMKRPISATSLPNDALSPNKKMHTQPPPPPQLQNQTHPLLASLTSPYLSYPGLPPGLGPSGAPQLPANLFGQNLMRTPPPNISSLFNSAAFTHLLNAHNFPRSPYLSHLQQPPTRSSNPYGPMSPYPPLGHHPPSLISGHGIPTSLPHVPQSNPMIRPSPPPMSNNSNHLNSGPPKLPLNLPITSSATPNQMDFSPNSVNSAAHQMQQQALNNSAAAAAAALGLPYGSPYFNPGSPLGHPMQGSQQRLG